jgi:flagellar motor component MotA
MTKNKFYKLFRKFFHLALTTNEHARREGLLALEESLGEYKNNQADIFRYGMRFVIDGTESAIIEKILTNIIEQETDKYTKLLKTIQKEAIMSIQNGLNPRLTAALINSYTDKPVEWDFND